MLLVTLPHFGVLSRVAVQPNVSARHHSVHNCRCSPALILVMLVLLILEAPGMLLVGYAACTRYDGAAAAEGCNVGVVGSNM